MKQYVTQSEQQTIELGKRLVQRLRGGEIIALMGDLGAGKTVLVRGLAQGLRIKGTINSPTFVLMKIYRPRKQKNKIEIKNLIHIDAYRLNSGQDLIDIGTKDWLKRNDSVVVIEWADRVKDILPKTVIKIKIEIGKEENIRIISIINYDIGNLG